MVDRLIRYKPCTLYRLKEITEKLAAQIFDNDDFDDLKEFFISTNISYHTLLLTL
jgi:hypothetical protein